MKRKERKEMQMRVQKQEDRAERWGVEIDDEVLFNDHVDSYNTISYLTMMLLVVFVVLFGVFMWETELSHQAKVAQDMSDLKGFCSHQPDGVFISEQMYLDCAMHEVRIQLG